MQKYISTYTQGLQKPVEKALKDSTPTVEIMESFDGLIAYETNAHIESVANLRFFNSSFLPIKEFTDLYGDVFKPMVQWAVRQDFPEKIRPLLKRYNINSFKVVMSMDNKIVGYNPGLLKDIQYKIIRTYKLNLDKSKPDAEFWFSTLNNGYGFFGLRLTNTSRVEHRDKGQIKPEIANIMCEISDQKETDIVLDPFLGYGTILYERLYKPYEKLIGFEINKEIHAKANVTGENVELINTSFFRNELPDHSINKIITDPPWGSHDEIDENYYNKIFKEFKRLITKDGIVVLLVSREVADDFREIFKKFNFKTEQSYELLVSGRKAVIYKLSVENN